MRVWTKYYNACSVFLYYSEEIPQVDGADDSDEDSQNQQVCFIRNNNYVYCIYITHIYSGVIVSAEHL